MFAKLKDNLVIFQAIAWSDIFLSESDIANFVCSDIIFAHKLGAAEYHTTIVVYHCEVISLAVGEYNCGTLPYEVCHIIGSFYFLAHIKRI